MSVVGDCASVLYCRLKLEESASYTKKLSWISDNMLCNLSAEDVIDVLGEYIRSVLLLIIV